MISKQEKKKHEFIFIDGLIGPVNQVGFQHGMQNAAMPYDFNRNAAIGRA